MFGIFKKKENVENVQTGKYPAIVEEIHNSFYTASDRLLDEANEILAKVTEDSIKKGVALKQIGFTQAMEVKESELAIKEREKAEKLAETVIYYKQKYPFNKFITEESVNLICEKYGLVQGGIELYKGFVPASKAEEVAKFNEKYKTDGSSYYELTKDLRDETIIHVKSIKIGYRGDERKKGKIFTKILEARNNTIVVNRSSIYSAEDSVKDFARTLKELDNSAHWIDGVEATHYRNERFYICAPAKDMDLKGSTIVNNKIVSNSRLKVTYVDKDPVVLQPVKHGYLIVCAWGDEASDPLVVNEINN